MLETTNTASSVIFFGDDQWWLNVWNPFECTIEPCTDGTYAVIDHSVQTHIATCQDHGALKGWLAGRCSTNSVYADDPREAQMRLDPRDSVYYGEYRGSNYWLDGELNADLD